MGVRRTIRRRIQLLGAVLLLSTFVLPVYSCRSGPADFGPAVWEIDLDGDGGADSTIEPEIDWDAGVRVPATEVVEEVGGGGLAAIPGLWEWFPYLFALFWPVGLIAAGRGEDARRRAGTLLFVTTALLAGLAFVLLWSRYDPVLPDGFEIFETSALMAAAGWVLFRRRWWSNRRDVEGFVAAQALVCLFHALSWPAYSVISWWGEWSAGAIARTIFTNYLSGYWLGVAGLLLALLPGLAPTRRAASGGTGPAPG